MTLSLAPTPLGLGCAALGNLYAPVDDDTAAAVVDQAWDLGVRLFDTAPLYGHGLSEMRLGRALAGRPRDDYLLSSKVGRLLVDGPAPTGDESIFADVPDAHPTFDYSADGVRRSIEQSLERLGLDRLDLVHVHDPDDHLDDAVATAYPTLLALRDEGIIGAVGLGTNSPEVATFVGDRIDLDWLLLAGRYTLLDQSGAAVLERCGRDGVSVLAAGVFNSGLLADPMPGARYDYLPASDAMLDRVGVLQSVCVKHRVPLTAAALQFVRRNPAVTTVLVGSRTPDEMIENHRLLDVDLPEALWDDLAELA